VNTPTRTFSSVVKGAKVAPKIIDVDQEEDKEEDNNTNVKEESFRVKLNRRGRRYNTIREEISEDIKNKATIEYNNKTRRSNYNRRKR